MQTLKVKLFKGYIIEDSLIYRDQEAVNKLEHYLQNNSVESLFTRLNGSFKYVIEVENLIYFGIDHFGGYPLFYSLNPALEIITNPREFASLSDINDNNLCSLLASGFSYGETTIYNKIKECLPGITYIYNKIENTLNRHEWFSIDYRKQKKQSKEEFADLLKSLIPTNFPQTHLALTGGIDSRHLLALFKKRGSKINAFTYGTPENNDIRIAKEVANQAQIDYTQYNFAHLNMKEYFSGSALDEFFTAGFLGRSLPFESDWVVSNLLKGSASWVTNGYTCFWLRSPDQDEFPIQNKSELVPKILLSHCQQTLISSKKFRELLVSNIEESMTHYTQEFDDSDFDRWNVENRQHKYIINSCNNFRHSEIEVLLPLFDRRFATFVNETNRDQKYNQKMYMETIISDIFTGKEAYLKEIPATSSNYNNCLQGVKPTLHSWKEKLHKLDKYNLNRVVRTPNNHLYGILQAVLLQSPGFLSLKIEDAFPNLKNTIATLRDLGLNNSANHLTWLKKKRVVQLNLLGIEIIGFLVEKFALINN